MDVKTILRTDRVTKLGKNYRGVLVRDGEDHYTFTETLPWNKKRNPHVFNGKYISITRQDDGTYRPNFKPLKMGVGFSVERYAFSVYLELHKALKGLVEEK